MERRENQIEIDDNLDWATLHEIIRAKYGLKDLCVKYVDDENEEIDMNTQVEFENAYALASLTDSRLKFVIRNKNGQKLDEILMNIHKKKQEMPIKQEEKKEEERLINFDNMFNLSTLIDSRITNEIGKAAISTNTDNNNNAILINENNPPEWFTDALKNLKSEILNDIEGKLKPLYEKFEELKLDKTLNNSAIDSQILSIETVHKLINELEEAKLLKDVLRVKDIEEELTAINAFDAKFIRDCNIPDGTRFEINTKFKKSWLLQNNGRLAWLDSKVKLINITGSIYCTNKSVDITNVDVNGLIEIQVELIAPEKPGIYISEWVLSYQNYMFGPRIWCAIEVVNSEVEKLTVKPTTTEESTQLYPILPSPTPSEFTRKLSTSSIIDERFKELVDLSDDDDSEFVIIPDCLDLTKKWEPNESSNDKSITEVADLSIDSDFNITKSESQHDDQLISQSTMVLVNELLLIPKFDNKDNNTKKYGEENKLQNLMTFSTSMNGDETNESIENIKIDHDDTLNDTVNQDDEKNLLIFSNDYSNNLNLLENSNNAAKAVAAATAINKEQEKIDRLLEISANAGAGININVLPSAPIMESLSPRTSLNSQQQQVRFSFGNQEPLDQLLSMGFANRTLNRKLLEKHNNNVEKVVEEILTKQDNDWASNRH